MCSCLPYSLYTRTYYHLQVPHSVFGKQRKTLFNLNCNHFSSLVTFIWLPTFTVGVTELLMFNVATDLSIHHNCRPLAQSRSQDLKKGGGLFLKFD